MTSGGGEQHDYRMGRATLCIKEGKTGFDKGDHRGDLKDLSFIMIDEYQDFSYLFDVFLESIRSVCPDAGIFCVGDDWQAINAFAGSEVRFFQLFTQRYPDSERYYLQTNYRSKREIVALGSELMDPGNGSNAITAANQGSGIVRIGYYSDFVQSQEERSIHGPDSLTPAVLRLVSHSLNCGKQVVFLTRTNDRLPLPFVNRAKTAGTSLERFLATIQYFFTPDQRKRIAASTTHKYKGEEEDVVIILDSLAGYYPLIHPTWIFQRVFGDTVGKLIEEEKRLFYVAISRAKDNLYILTTRGEESPFVESLGTLAELNWDDYPPLRSKETAIRIEVSNQRGFSPGATMAIKELLMKDQFKWDAEKKVWYLFYSKEGFEIRELFEREWAKAADHVILIRYGERDKKEEAYLFVEGIPQRLQIRQ